MTTCYFVVHVQTVESRLFFPHLKELGYKARVRVEHNIFVSELILEGDMLNNYMLTVSVNHSTS